MQTFELILDALSAVLSLALIVLIVRGWKK